MWKKLIILHEWNKDLLKLYKMRPGLSMWKAQFGFDSGSKVKGQILFLAEPVLTFNFWPNAAWEQIKLESRETTQMKDSFKLFTMVIYLFLVPCTIISAQIGNIFNCLFFCLSYTHSWAQARRWYSMIFLNCHKKK